MSIKRKFKWLHLRNKISKRKKRESNLEFDNPQQKEAIEFVEYIINKNDSELSLLPDMVANNSDYYITNKDIIIIFNRKFLSITSENNKYDTMIFDKLFDRLYDKLISKIIKKRKIADKRLNKIHNNILEKLKNE